MEHLVDVIATPAESKGPAAKPDDTPDPVDGGDGSGEEWTAKEVLVMWGGGISLIDNILVIKFGIADVTFQNKTGRKFQATFPVTTWKEYGASCDFFGRTRTETTYARKFDSSPTDQDIINSFKGGFITVGVSKGYAILGGSMGYTTVYDDGAKFGGSYWGGSTTGYSTSIGIGFTVMSVSKYGKGKIR